MSATTENAAAFSLQRERERNGIPLPCQAHQDWLKRLDDRMWTILVTVAGGALASVVTLLIIVMRTPPAK